MTEDRAPRKYTRPATIAGQDLLERTSLAAGTLTAILRDRGIHEYNLRDWMPESNEIVAIELEAGSRIDMRTLIEVLREGGYYEAAGEISDNEHVIAQLYAQAMAAKAKGDS